MCTYLHGPREGGTYYFRRSIPRHLRTIIGQLEWMYSLRTKDPAEARRKVRMEAVRTDLLVQEAEKVLADTTAEAVQRVTDTSRAQATERDRIRAEEEWAASED